MKPLVVIVGPTASGKTDLSLKLAQRYNGEIICADSRTLYKDFIIGTASPILNLKLKTQNSKWGKVFIAQGVPHYLLHFVKPNQVFTVAEFQKLAYQIIDDILGRNKIPFLVGGTGLYVDAVVKGYAIPEVAPDLSLRKKLEKESVKKLYQKLKKLDSVAAKKILPSNKRRIIRALEVCLTTGQSISSQQKVKKPSYDILTIGISRPKEELYERINQRVNKQIKMGFTKEVKKLIKKGYSPKLPAMTGLGYKQIANYLVNKNPETLKEAIEQIKRDTRHFARRQISWFKRDENIKWVAREKEANRLIKSFLKRGT